ncbi:MAG: thioredoxin family protein [Coprobacter sp.]|nr:thioredoxin family protein [Coprobacter sp.]
MKKLLVCIALCLPFLTSKAQEQPADTTGIQFLHGTYAEALQAAKEAGRLLFVDCYTQWCGPCKQLAKITFRDPAVAEFYNESFTCLKLDMETPDGVAQKDHLGVSAYPTMVFVDPKTNEVVHKMVGFSGPEEFLKRTVSGLTGNNISTMTARYDAGERSDEFMKEYFQVLTDANATDRLAQLVPAWLDDKCEAMLTDKDLFGYFMAYVNDPYSKPFRYFLDNKAAFEQQYTDRVTAIKESRIWNMHGRTYVAKADDGTCTLDENAFAEYKKYMKDNKVKDAAKIELATRMYLHECNNAWKDYITCGDKLINKYDVDALEIYNWALRIDKNCTDTKLRNHAAIWCDAAAREIEAATAALGNSGMMRMGPQATHFTALAQKLRTNE